METSHFNKLSEPEAERLAILAEECGEVIQVIGKILRHGYDSHNPHKPELGPNRDQLEHELGDLVFAVVQLEKFRDVQTSLIEQWAKLKSGKIKPYLHHTEVR